MKKCILFFLFTGILLLKTNSSKAQYQNAIGVRLGDASGVTFKTFLDSDKALDIILDLKSRNKYSLFRLTGLYEKHLPLGFDEVPGIRWYYGGGGSIGNYRNKVKDENQLYLSADGVIGLDYKFDTAPINLSLDWKPSLELSPSPDFNGNGLGLSVRITF